MPIRPRWSGRGAREHVIYDFQGGSDGASPQGTLIADASGALYGTTEYGGSGGGTVFRLMPAGSSYTETILHVFTGSTDGTGPFGGLTMDAVGDLFGATLLGGGGSQCNTSEGCGIVFELKRAGSSYAERILHRFTGGRDGATPGSPPIFVGKNLYGTPATGGARSTVSPARRTMPRIRSPV